MMYTRSSTLGPTQRPSTWAVHIASLALAASYISCKFANSWLGTSSSNERTVTLFDKCIYGWCTCNTLQGTTTAKFNFANIFFTLGFGPNSKTINISGYTGSSVIHMGYLHSPILYYHLWYQFSTTTYDINVWLPVLQDSTVWQWDYVCNILSNINNLLYPYITSVIWWKKGSGRVLGSCDISQPSHTQLVRPQLCIHVLILQCFNCPALADVIKAYGVFLHLLVPTLAQSCLLLQCFLLNITASATVVSRGLAEWGAALQNGVQPCRMGCGHVRLVLQ